MRRPSFPHLATAAVICLPIVYALPFPKSPNDYAVYVAVGRRMFETMGLADTVFLAHTVRGAPYVNGTWLSPLVFAAWDALGGTALAVALHALCVGAAIWVPLIHARRRGASPGAAGIAVLLCVPLLLGNLGLRPQTLILWVFGALHWIGALHAHKRWAPWAVGALAVLWTNTHGAFPLIIPLMGTFFVEALVRGDRAASRQTGILLLVGTAATLCTPYGGGVWAYVFDNIGISMIIGSQEFEGVTGSSWRFLRLVAAAGVAAVLLTGRPRPRWADGFAAAGLAIPAFSSQRMAIWWGLALIPILADRLATADRWADARAVRLSPWAQRPLTPLFFFLAAVTISRSRHTPEADRFIDPLPLHAAEAIRTALPDGARLYNSAEWGSTLAWKLGPEWPVYIDIRAWIYPEAIWSEYARIARADDGWQSELERRQIDAVAVDLPRFWRLDEALAGEAGWERALAGETGAVWVRADYGD